MKQPDKPRATKRAAKPKAGTKATASKVVRSSGIFKQDVAEEIFSQLIEGKSLAEICRQKGMPKYRTVFQWLQDDERFALDYARAREAQADTDADRIGEIAGKVAQGLMDPQAARVAIDAYKWTAGKRKPKVYGDKLDLTHANPDGTPISKIEVEFVNGPKISDG